MSKNKIIILATEGLTTSLLFHSLRSEGFDVELILENPESNIEKIKRRFKKLPFLTVVGQLFFIVTILPFLKLGVRKRIGFLVHSNGRGNVVCPADKLVRIKSANGPEVIKLISERKPDFVFLNGTRILKKNILDQLSVPVLNIHVGITPAYRGIHGGYWALYNGKKSKFGVTFHYVDAGVDTGKIISQKIIQVDKQDNFVSYPVVQFMAGIELAIQFLSGKKQEPDSVNEGFSESKQYYHPTFFQYLLKRLRYGVK